MNRSGSISHRRDGMVYWVRCIAGLLVAMASLAAGAPQHRWTRHEHPASFERLTIAQGLSQNTVYCMLQDRRGFMWFGTEVGLNRYDGNRFITFGHDKFNSNSLSGNWITCLLEDETGLWIGTSDGGVNRIESGTQAIRRFPEAEGVLSTDISCMAKDRDGNLWFGSMGDGLGMVPAGTLSNAKLEFQAFRRSDETPNLLPGDVVSSLFLDSRGELWIGFLDAGLCRLIRSKSGQFTFERFSAKSAGRDVSAPPEVTVIEEDSHGVLWLGSNSGLYSLSADRRVFRHYQHQGGDGQSLSHNLVRRIYRDRVGDIWIGTDGGGLDKMLRRERSDAPAHFKHFPNDPKNARSLASNAVESIYEDRSGVLWVGAYQQGLNKLVLNPKRSVDREQKALIQYQHSPMDPNSLSGNTVNAFCEDHLGNLWIGTDGDGLNRVLPPGDGNRPLEFIRYRADKKRAGALQDDVITCLYEDSKQRLWAGTYTKGLVRIDASGTTVRFTHHRPNPKHVLRMSDFIVSICEASDHRLWIGTVGGGLYLFDPETELFHQSKPADPVPPNFAADSNYYAMVMDGYGTLWLACSDGVDRYNPKTGQFRLYRPGDRPEDIPYPFINTLHIDASGTLWMGSSGGGLYKTSIPSWDGAEPRFTCYDTRNGLPGNVVLGILSDAHGQIWLSTDHALCRFDPWKNVGHPFVWQEEFRDSGFLRNACYRSASGELFFGGGHGFGVFHPDDITPNTVVSPVVLTDFKLFNESVSIGRKVNGRTLLQNSIANTDSITLSYKDYVFSIEFAAMHYVAPDKNQYAYKLEGLDRNWNDVGNQHLITYTTLPPGDYKLLIKAANCDGFWSEPAQLLKIHILPPWWRTWWFRGVIVFLLLLLIYLTVRFRLRSLHNRNRMLEKMVQARTEELAKAMGELAEANEALRTQSLTDPLTGLWNRRFLSVCMPEDVSQIQRDQRNVNTNNRERMALNIDVLFILVDLDHFKIVNDRHGHHAGDRVLQQVGEILREASRKSDTVARWGGEEFLVVARNSARTDAQIVPERIRAAVESTPFDIGEGKKLHCTCSIGFSVFPLLPGRLDQFKWEQVIDLADQCLYAAKRAGRNGWVGAIPDLATFDGVPDDQLPKDVSELLRSQKLPIIRSMDGPLHWEFEEDS